MSNKLQLGLLFGGRSGEHEVSLLSARSVMTALDRSKYDVLPIGITHDGQWLSGQNVLEAFEQDQIQDLEQVAVLAEPGLRKLFRWGEGRALEMLNSLDILFPVLHGPYGEDGTMQGLMELADIPYVGAGVLASSIGMDKCLFKYIMRANHIPVVDWMLVLSTQLEKNPDEVFTQAEQVGPYPLFTKPANMGSSVGITKCRNRSDLLEGLIEAARYDRRVLVEKGVDAREIEVSVLGNEDPQASIPGEIVPSDEFYSYRAKYLDGTSELLIPAPIDQEIVEEVQRISVQAFKAIDGAGMARVDFLLERETGKLYMNEINTIPGFTKISMYPKLWEASGLSYSRLLDRLIELAIERQGQKDRLVRTYEGAT